VSAERGVPWVLRAAATVIDDPKVGQRGRASLGGQLLKDPDELEVLLSCSPRQVGVRCR
jgi:hypothetical protein